jgi:Enoyl-(Acyl carrier protein) reductase
LTCVKGYASRADIQKSKYFGIGQLLRPHGGFDEPPDGHGVWLLAHLAEPLVRNRGSLHGGGAQRYPGPRISPGPLATRAASGIPEFDEPTAKAQAKGVSRSLVSIDDVGRAIALLALDGARLVTGDTIYIDGGYHVID